MTKLYWAVLSVMMALTIALIIIPIPDAKNADKPPTRDPPLTVLYQSGVPPLEQEPQMVCIDGREEQHTYEHEDVDEHDEVMRFCVSYYDIRDAAYHRVGLSKENQYLLGYFCDKYDVPFDIMMGIFGAETGWKIDYGTSPNGKYCGIGMLHIEYNAESLMEYGIDILTPCGAMEGSVFVFSKKLKRFGNIEKAIIAYNLGDRGAMMAEEHTSYSRFVLMISDGLVFEKYNEGEAT